MTARNHHFLPQSYLKGFALDPNKPQLRVLDLEQQKSFIAHVRNIAAERDFNRIDTEDHPPDVLETRLAAVEGEIAAAISRISNARTLDSPEDLGSIVYLITLVHLRNPRFRAKIGDFMEDIMKDVMRITVATPERFQSMMRRTSAATEVGSIAYDDMKEFVEEDEYRVKVAREYQIDLEISTVDKIVPVVAARKWTLCRAGDGTGGFVTSDHPTPLWWNKPDLSSSIFPPGLGLTDTTLIFPLTKGLCMVGTFEGQADVLTLGIQGVAALNSAVIRFADRQVYASDDRFVFLAKDKAVKFGYDLATMPPRAGHARRPR